MAQGPVQQHNPGDMNFGAMYPQSNSKETLAGAKTLSNTDEQVQILDPGGAGRDVNLPADEQGLYFWVVNSAAALNPLTVKDSDGNIVVTVNQNEVAIVYNYGSGWVAVAGGNGPTQDT